MTSGNPQFFYMVLVLPGLFGLTLLGEGVNKVFHEQWGGIFLAIFGFVFIGAAVFAYLFFFQNVV